MYDARLIAIVTDKRTRKSSSYQVMEMRYKVKENVLWLVDHRGSIFDFDLDEVDVEIKGIENNL